MTCSRRVFGLDGADRAVGGLHFGRARLRPPQLGGAAEGGRACWPQLRGVGDSLGSGGHSLAAPGYATGGAT